MATFTWSGRTAEGVVRQGELAAGSREEVVSILRRDRISPTSIQQKEAQAKSGKVKGKRGGKVSDKDMVVFTRQLATMIGAGLPLVQSLELIASQAENPTLARVLNEVRASIEGGENFSDSIRKHPKVFDSLYVNMVAAGEVGGAIDTILNRLAKYIEKNIGLKRKVKTAMIYPAVIVSVATIVVTIMLIWVIPVFAKLFGDFGADLPMLTQIVINLSYFMRRNFIWIAIAVGGTGYAFVRYYNTEAGRAQIDRIALKAPIFGPLIQKVAVAKFTRTLGTLISNGVNLMDGMDITAKSAGNKTIEMAIQRVRQEIASGKTVAEPLGKENVFPKMVVSMLAVGESTGSMDTMLGKIADFYDDEVDVAVNNLTAMLEPLFIVFLGVAVGTLVIAMYLPIFKMASVIG
jgi:type IV pilus assembly protein PilC